jgi:uncharacterized integral membrane protein
LYIFQLPAISIPAILCEVTETPEESRVDRLTRHASRTFVYVWSGAIVAVLVILIALIVENTRTVTVSWVVGDARTRLIWVIVASGVLGWLAGLATAILLRQRTRRNRHG